MFIKFTEHGKSHKVKASISNRGMLSFSDGARQQFDMDHKRFCILYFDPDTLQIGIELTSNDLNEGTRRIRFRRTGADVHIKSYLQYFEIVVKETTQYDVYRDTSSGLVIIDLTAGTINKRKNRRTL